MLFRSQVTSFLVAPPPLPAHQGTLSCHARVSGGAPRRRQSPGRRLAFPSPSIAERAPGPRAAGGPRHPQTVLRPHPAVLFPPGALPGSETRKVLSPPACPRAPQTPMPSAGNWQETPRCWRFGGALRVGGSSRTRGIRDWRIRGLRGPGQAPVPGPQVHVKVQRQVPGAGGRASRTQSQRKGPPHLGAAQPPQGSVEPPSSAGVGAGLQATKARPSPAAVAPPTLRHARGDLQLPVPVTKRIAGCTEAGLCSLEPPIPPTRPPLPPGLRGCGGSPRSSAALAPGPWPLLAVPACRRDS